MHQAVFEPDRSFVAVDGDAFVGELMGATMRMTVPGPVVARVGGVTSAGVVPTHQRRGVLTALMRRHLEDAKEREEPISALHASEGRIYGRFGYGVGTWNCEVSIETRRSSFRDATPVEGSVRMVDKDEALRVMPGVYGRFAETRPGVIDRSPSW